jgi:hypothetical protein
MGWSWKASQVRRTNLTMNQNLAIKIKRSAKSENEQQKSNFFKPIINIFIEILPAHAYDDKSHDLIY